MSKKKKTPPLKINFANEEIHRLQFGLTFKLVLSKHYTECKLPATHHCKNIFYGDSLNDYYDGFNDHGAREIIDYGEEIRNGIEIIAYRESINKNSGGLKLNIHNLQNPKYNFRKRKKWLKKTYRNIKKYAPNSFIINDNIERNALKIFANSVSSCYLKEIKIPSKNYSISSYIKEQESNFKLNHPEK